MYRSVFVVSVVALMLGGCLSSGSNPNCRTTVLPGQGDFQLCSVGNVIFLEPVAGTYVAQGPAPNAAEPVAAAEAPPQEPALEIDPATGEPSLGEEEPVVIN